jgi:hypothetical protein
VDVSESSALIAREALIANDAVAGTLAAYEAVNANDA